MAWKGKLEATLTSCFTMGSKDKVTCFAIAGGPETQWERRYLLDELPNGHHGQAIDVLCCNDLDDFCDCLERSRADATGQRLNRDVLRILHRACKL